MAFSKRFAILFLVITAAVVVVVATSRHETGNAVAAGGANVDACDRDAQRTAGLSETAQRELADKCFRSGSFTKSEKREW